MNMKTDDIDASLLLFSGERYVPGVEGSIKLEHLHRYLVARKLVEGKCVLDIACGEGYGSAMLSRTALHVTGVDISQEAVSHAQVTYQAKNLEYHLGSCSSIPLGDASVEVVISFETIEHHDEHEAMMREIKRVLRPGGILVLSSPDKLEYSDKPGYSNPYHVKELYRDELHKLLGAHFANHSIYGQRVIYGSAIFCEDGSSPIESYDMSDDNLRGVPGVYCPVYLVAVASDAELPCLASGLLEQPLAEADMVKELTGGIEIRDLQISDLHRQLLKETEKVKMLSCVIAERDKQLHELRQSFIWRMTKPVRRLVDFVRGKN